MKNEDSPAEKLQVRLTVAALERLIGNDKEMELILSHQAVQQVVEQKMTKIVERVGKVIDDTVRRSFGVDSHPGMRGSWQNNFVISSTVGQAIETFVNIEVEKKVREYLNSLKFKEVIDRRVNDSIERESVQVVVKSVTDQTQKMIQAAVFANPPQSVEPKMKKKEYSKILKETVIDISQSPVKIPLHAAREILKLAGWDNAGVRKVEWLEKRLEYVAELGIDVLLGDDCPQIIKDVAAAGKTENSFQVI